MLKGIVAAVLVLGGLGAAFGSGDDTSDGGDGSPDKPSPSAHIGDKWGAQDVCQEFVKRRLKAPSTAEFSGEAARHLSGPTWVVAGDVDAENSFGAMLRNKYVCKVRFVSGDQWRLVNLDMF